MLLNSMQIPKIIFEYIIPRNPYAPQCEVPKKGRDVLDVVEPKLDRFPKHTLVKRED